MTNYEKDERVKGESNASAFFVRGDAPTTTGIHDSRVHRSTAAAGRVTFAHGINANC